jgi:hypothetical protein
MLSIRLKCQVNTEHVLVFNFKRMLIAQHKLKIQNDEYRPQS